MLGSRQLNQAQATAPAAASKTPAMLIDDDRCGPGSLEASGAPPGQALRLRRIREIYPGIDIIRRGPWQAVIPEPDGERTVVRWELSDLLDRLDTLAMARLPQASQ
jgi:hypothetical protein